MMRVVVTYDFPIVAGKGMSSPDSIVNEAHRIANEFFSDRPFDLDIQVSGRKDNWIVNVSAVSIEESDGPR